MSLFSAWSWQILPYTMIDDFETSRKSQIIAFYFVILFTLDVFDPHMSIPSTLLYSAVVLVSYLVVTKQSHSAFLRSVAFLCVHALLHKAHERILEKEQGEEEKKEKEIKEIDDDEKKEEVKGKKGEIADAGEKPHKYKEWLTWAIRINRWMCVASTLWGVKEEAVKQYKEQHMTSKLRIFSFFQDETCSTDDKLCKVKELSKWVLMFFLEGSEEQQKTMGTVVK